MRAQVLLLHERGTHMTLLLWLGTAEAEALADFELAARLQVSPPGTLVPVVQLSLVRPLVEL